MLVGSFSKRGDTIDNYYVKAIVERYWLIYTKKSGGFIWKSLTKRESKYYVYFLVQF